MNGSGILKKRISRLIILMIIMVLPLLLSGCRSRLTNLSDASTTVVDEDGMMSDEYEMRRYELDLYDTRESIFSGLSYSDESDEDEEYDEYDEEFDEMMDDYRNTEYEEDEDYDDISDDDDSDDNNTTNSNTNTNSNRTTVIRRPGTTTTTTKVETQNVTITFDPNGGSVSSKSKVITIITRVTGSTKTTQAAFYGTLPTPEKSGYTFEGWYTAKSKGTKITSTTKVTNTKNHTIYAHWKEIPQESFTITFDPNGGEIKSGDASKVLRKGDAYGEFPGVMYEGYKLKGWFTSADGGDEVTTDSVFKGSKDATLYAQWEYDAYAFWNAQLDSVSVNEDDMADCCIILDGNKTTNKSKLLDGSKVNNVAGSKDKNLGNSDSTAEWISKKDPAYVVWIVKDMGDAEDIENEIRSKISEIRAGSGSSGDGEEGDGEGGDVEPQEDWAGEFIFLPETAVSGSDNEQLYYKMDLCNRVYSVFYDEDMNQAAEELEVSPE